MQLHLGPVLGQESCGARAAAPLLHILHGSRSLRTPEKHLWRHEVCKVLGERTPCGRSGVSP